MTDQNDESRPESERRRSDSLRLRSVAPSLTVDDIETSLAWYRDVVRFTVKETFEEDGALVGASLVAGSVNVLLFQDDGAKGTDRLKGGGFRLYMGTAMDVDELAGAIEERGGTLTSGPEDMPWGARAFSLEDPDGFALTITSDA